MRAKLVQWLRRQIYGREGLCKLQIKHVLSGNKIGSEVHSFGKEQVKESLTPEELDSLVVDIEQITGDDAAGVGGVQKYALLATFENGDSARFVLRVQSDDQDNEEIDSEPPTKAGLVAQQMRHNEAIMRVSAMSFQQVITMQNRIIVRLSEQNEQMMGKHMELMTAIEGLHTEKHLRDLETRKADAQLEHKKEIVQKLLLLAPTVVNKITGKHLMPVSQTPEDLQVHQLMASMTKEQMESLMAQGTVKFTVDQLMVIHDIYQRELERHDAINKKKTETNGAKE